MMEFEEQTVWMSVSAPYTEEKSALEVLLDVDITLEFIVVASVFEDCIEVIPSLLPKILVSIKSMRIFWFFIAYQIFIFQVQLLSPWTAQAKNN